jgi:phosphoadenosine phosphosulfate reductase
MQRALAGFDAWVSGVRRDQGPTRANTEVVEHHVVDGRPLAKVYPLAYWSRGQIWGYLLEQGIPYNPLLDRCYASLGCWPCTRATRAGEDERAGRWAGTGKTECGLHTFTTSTDREGTR